MRKNPISPTTSCRSRRFESSSFILALIRLRASRFPWLQSGKASLEQRDPNPAPRHLHDLNLSPPSPPVASLGLKLASPSAEYQSVCTLEKVKSALERESRLVATTGPASPPPSSSTTTTTSSSSSSSSSSTSTKRRAPTSPDEDGAAGSTMAVAACPVLRVVRSGFKKTLLICSSSANLYG
ncbi:NOI protein, nitrate-induced [Musa troglodytarum]|uniref:NOI protein, nitrate-induced n=1 Tax=Musa troglodytarum TaxID=320322 RepID=A0A9E7H1D1_9LILI|nr:NOI protein, nitrate-induced [Musa troglodytarum]